MENNRHKSERSPVWRRWNGLLWHRHPSNRWTPFILALVLGMAIWQLAWTAIAVVSGTPSSVEDSPAEGNRSLRQTGRSTNAVKAQRKESYFLVLYRPGAAWVNGQEIRKQPLGEHVAYMRTLQAAGTLRLGGPFKDDSGGMVILEAATRQAAEDIVRDDPAVRGRIFSFQVHPWHPAAPGHVEGRSW